MSSKLNRRTFLGQLGGMTAASLAVRAVAKLEKVRISVLLYFSPALRKAAR
jgi:hypothetical protein